MTRLPSGPRLTLAADLNDLITHRVAAAGVQAAAAERLLGTAAGCGAATAIRAVRGLTAEAMDELSRLARLLDDGTPASLTPMPSDVPGVAEALPGGVAVCAYRCVERLAGHELTFVVDDSWLEIRGHGTLEPHLEGSLRAFVRPCAGSLRRRRDAWSIRLPLEP